MRRRRGLDIKKKILQLLKENGEMTFGDLERKTNTNNLTILTHLEELEYFGKIEIARHPKSKKTGRPYTTVRLKTKS